MPARTSAGPRPKTPPSRLPELEPPGEGLLYFFYFAPEAWGRGFATLVMAAVMDDFRDLVLDTAHLWVLAENHRARRSYDGHGWREDGPRRTDDYGETRLEALRYSIAVDGNPPILAV